MLKQNTTKKMLCMPKIGHNKSTCPAKYTETTEVKSKIPKSNKQPLRFYVHHVVDEPKKSSNVIDLKKHNIWNEVDSCSPFLQNSKNYHNYHTNQSKTTKSHPLPTQPNSNFIKFLLTPNKDN